MPRTTIGRSPLRPVAHGHDAVWIVIAADRHSTLGFSMVGDAVVIAPGVVDDRAPAAPAAGNAIWNQ